MPFVEAIELADRILQDMRVNGLDLVREEWMAKGPRGGTFDWSEIAENLEELEMSGRTPWNSPELH